MSKIITPITSAEKYMNYLKTKADYPDFPPPKTVITIYSSSLLKRILADYNYRQGTRCFDHLYLIDDGKVAVFYIGGMGAPALIHKMEELIAFGVKKFISVGYAGTLTKEFSIGDFVVHSKALSEDGVGHLYLGKWSSFAHANSDFRSAWSNFMKEKYPELPIFKEAVSWSFPVLFLETKEDVERVVNLGCNTVEMEVAAFFAITQKKNVQGLALYVISDSLADGEWLPHLQESGIKDGIKNVTDLAIEFSNSLD
jgi:purine-nucleoside phosphorylase